MKKLLLIAVLSGMLFTNVKAQDVYNEILKTSLQVAENEKNDIETRKIATFKFDALNYMKQKVIPEVLKDTTDLKTMNKVINQLNQQSYAMYQFINYFCERISGASKKKDKEIVIALFTNASLNNPMFNDTDKDLVLAYYNNENYITRFSLDTDWEKALQQVRKNK